MTTTVTTTRPALLADASSVLDLQGMDTDDNVSMGLTSNLSFICKFESTVSLYLCPTNPGGNSMEAR